MALEIDRLLSHVTRRISAAKGAARIIDPIRRKYAAAYGNRGDGWVTITDYDGDLKMRVDRSAYLGSHIYWYGYHHRWELEYLKRVLQPNMVFLDVGANQGTFTLFTAKRLSAGRVLAFEPESNMRALLVENLSLNGLDNVQCFDFGLGRRPERRELFTSGDLSLNLGRNEGLFSSFRSDDRNTYVQEILVRPMDSVLSDLNVDRVDAIKIDVEGGELDVLLGGQKTLGRWKPKLILEISDSAFRDAGYTKQALRDLLEPLGYRFYRIYRGATLRTYEFPEGLSQTSFNIICE